MDFCHLINFCDKEQVEYQIDGKTAPLTTINVGNLASLIVFPQNLLIFCRILDIIVSKKYKFAIIGNGSNCYFNDYYNGVVVVTKKLNDISVNNNKITAMCGADITSVAVD